MLVDDRALGMTRHLRTSSLLSGDRGEHLNRAPVCRVLNSKEPSHVYPSGRLRDTEMYRYRPTKPLSVGCYVIERPSCHFDRQRRPIGIDLFAGAGGLSLGFESAGFDVAAAIEIDPIHCATHEFNFPYCATICRSVESIDSEQIRTMAGIGNAHIGVVFGGAPCQGFSMIGKRALDDPRNALLSHFVRLVLELEPAYFAFENVSGLAVGRQRDALEEMIDAFCPAYRVLLPYKVLNAADFGVPQNRRRLFLIGAREGQELPSYPQPIARKITVSEALNDLPDIDKYDDLTRRDWIKVNYGTPSAYASRLRGLLKDSNDYSRPRKFDATMLTSSLRTLHTTATRARFATTACGQVEPISRLHKLHARRSVQYDTGRNCKRPGLTDVTSSHTPFLAARHHSPRGRAAAFIP